jgi:hypothetical protein
METIFEHTPSKDELLQLVGDKTREEYIQSMEYLPTPEGANLLCIALLYQMRKNKKTAKKYIAMVPDLYQEWILGNDNVMIPID